MTTLILKARLARFVANSGNWVSSGSIQRVVAEKTKYTPQNVGRRLRELENEKVLEVKYIKNHAYYKTISPIKVAQVEHLMEEYWQSIPQKVA